MIEAQKHLLYTTERLVRSDLKSQKLRGVTAVWKEEDHTACLSFYFDGPISDEDVDEASDICGGIIANFSDGLTAASVDVSILKSLFSSITYLFKLI